MPFTKKIAIKVPNSCLGEKFEYDYSVVAHDDMFFTGWVTEITREDCSVLLNKRFKRPRGTKASKCHVALVTKDATKITKALRAASPKSDQHKTLQGNGDLAILASFKGDPLKCPEAFLLFDINIGITKRGYLSEMTLNLSLVWAKEQSRGTGIGRYLIAALIAYIYDVGLAKFMKCNGIPLTIKSSGAETREGAVFSSMTVEAFSLQSELWNAETEAGLPFREVIADIETDYLPDFLEEMAKTYIQSKNLSGLIH